MKSKKERHESCNQVIDSNLMLSTSANDFESRDLFDYLGQTFQENISKVTK